MDAHQQEGVGVVAIGRNEGERLVRCLASVQAGAEVVVYVDSGSTDGSREHALACANVVVDLDMTLPFTAARARNEGVAALRRARPTVEFVQFVDGDCEVSPGWLEQAQAFLRSHPDTVAVCGRRRERYPERSVYNSLCDLEWDTPVGEARAFGGDAMVRVSALLAVGGYREDLIAGEEPELCVRLRAAGWKIRRLEAEMTLHDAAITRFSQWWNRTTRAGFAFAQGSALHGAPPERHWVRECRSAWAWGFVLPLTIVVGAAVAGPVALLAFAAYPLQVLRLASKSAGPERWARAFFLVLGKFAEAAGQLKYLARRHAGGPVRLIEYK